MYEPDKLDSALGIQNPYKGFQDHFFPKLYDDLEITHHNANMPSEADRGSVVLKNNLKILKTIPSELDDIISFHATSLGIYYQVYLANHLVSGLLTLDESTSASYNTGYQKLLSKFEHQTFANAKIVSKHVKNAKESFFPKVDDDKILVGTVDLSSEITLGKFFRTMSLNHRELLGLEKFSFTPVKDIVKNKVSIGGEQVSPKFDMLTHPFVYAVNCAYLHHRLFVLSLNTDSEFSFLLNTDNIRTDGFSMARDVLLNKITMDQAITNFVNDNESTFQRNKEDIAQILFGVHVESMRFARRFIHASWTEYCSERLENNIELAISSSQNHFKALAEQSSRHVFGWS